MLKFLSILSFTLIYLSASAQKATYYKDPSVDLNKFNYFYLPNSPLDAHDLTNPYIDISKFNDNENSYFILYNEFSLKNLSVIDGHSDISALSVNLYEGTAFDSNIQTPKGYKAKKIKKNSLIIDLVDGSTKLLIWRGWIDLSRVKSTNSYQLYQRAITCILKNLQMEPVIAE